MPAEGVASPPVAAVSPRSRAAGSQKPGLGIAAFCLAVFFAIQPDIWFGLVRNFSDADRTGIIGLFSIASLLPFVLGIVATVTRRGRYWGIAALTLSLLSNFLVFAFVSVFHVFLGADALAGRM